MENTAEHTPTAQDLFITWFDDLDTEAHVDSEETRSRDLCELGFMAGRASLLDVNADLLAALEILLTRADSLNQSATHDGLQNIAAIVGARSAIAKARGQ